MADRRGWLRSALALAAGFGLARPLPSRADAWPRQPLRLLVAYPPGGVSDETARGLARGLAERLKVPVVVEHRPGAGGALAMAELARAPADGHTLCFSAISPLVLAPLLGPVRYDPERDFAPVIAVVHTPVLLLAHPGFAATTLAQAVVLARQSPGRVRWASGGVGTTGHLVMEQVRQLSGSDITHVPYQGGGQPLTDALGGQFELLSSNAGAAQVQYVRQGRLRALAVGAPARLPALPEVPTFAEAGYARANLMSTFGIFAPRATPPAVVQALNQHLQALLDDPARQARQTALGNLAAGGPPQAFEAQIQQARQASAGWATPWVREGGPGR